MILCRERPFLPESKKPRHAIYLGNNRPLPSKMAGGKKRRKKRPFLQMTSKSLPFPLRFRLIPIAPPTKAEWERRKCTSRRRVLKTSCSIMMLAWSASSHCRINRRVFCFFVFLTFATLMKSAQAHVKFYDEVITEFL